MSRLLELGDVKEAPISKHLANIYTDRALLKDPTVSKMEIVQQAGTCYVNKRKAIIVISHRGYYGGEGL